MRVAMGCEKGYCTLMRCGSGGCYFLTWFSFFNCGLTDSFSSFLVDVQVCWSNPIKLIFCYVLMADEI